MLCHLIKKKLNLKIACHLTNTVQHYVLQKCQCHGPASPNEISHQQQQQEQEQDQQQDQQQQQDQVHLDQPMMIFTGNGFTMKLLEQKKN